LTTETYGIVGIIVFLFSTQKNLLLFLLYSRTHSQSVLIIMKTFSENIIVMFMLPTTFGSYS